MQNTHTSCILSQLTTSGFCVTKDVRENHWELRDGKDVLAHSKSLGDLCRRVAKELGIEWEQVVDRGYSTDMKPGHTALDRGELR